MTDITWAGRAAEANFLASATAFPECEYAVHSRWTHLLMHLPKLRGRSLYEDMSDIYREAWVTGSSDNITVVRNLCALQLRFFEQLLDVRMIDSHLYMLQKTHLEHWSARLAERIPQITPTKRDDFRIRKGKTPPPKLPVWIN